MSDWSDEVEARLEARLHTIPAGVSECCQPCADIRAALGEIEHFHAIHKWCHRTPTHGKCCTCQACGLDYDSCRCDLDEQVERAEAAEARLAEVTRIARASEECARAERIRCRDEWAKSEAKLAEAQAEIDRLREALTFYSDTRRYQGANQPYRDGDDAYTPTGSPFLIDTTRDGGSIARAALRGGEEHSKHPTGDYCVYCLSQWPCVEAGEQ